MTEQVHVSRPDRELARQVETSKAPAISRAAAVLRLLGRSEAPLGVQAIARRLGLVPSTCLYVLRALVAEELVSFDPVTKRYALEAGVLTLARHWIRRNRFNDLAEPVLERLSQTFGVMTMGVHIVGLEHIVVVAVSQSGPAIQLSTQIGNRFPALLSATGRCIAAFGGHSEAELQARWGGLRWDDPPSYEQWSEQVQQTYERGFAVDEGNYIAGMTVVAAPVWKTRSKLSHAIAAIGMGNALKQELPAVQGALLSAARTLSSQLCGEL